MIRALINHLNPLMTHLKIYKGFLALQPLVTATSQSPSITVHTNDTHIKKILIVKKENAWKKYPATVQCAALSHLLLLTDYSFQTCFTLIAKRNCSCTVKLRQCHSKC